MPLSPAQIQTVQSVFLAIQARFRWIANDDIMPYPEDWSPLVERHGELLGCCHNHARSCWDRLRQAGLPVNLLRMAVCRVDQQQDARDHCVLAVGDAPDPGYLLVLDCREAALCALGDLDYDLWALSQAGRPLSDPWVVLAPVS